MNEGSHDCVALLITAWMWDVDDVERQSHSIGLTLQKFQSGGVHGNAPVCLIRHGKKTEDVNLWVFPKDVQRPCTVLPAAPAQQCSFLHFSFCRTIIELRVGFWKILSP
jgi:hypothetical protein